MAQARNRQGQQGKNGDKEQGEQRGMGRLGGGAEHNGRQRQQDVSGGGGVDGFPAYA